MPDSRDHQRWVEYAEENWQVAVSLLGKISATTTFLFHESIEKYLKAVLLFESKRPTPIHDLMQLLSQTSEPPSETSREMQAAELLDLAFGVSRYPDRSLEISLENTEAVYQAAIILRAFARERLEMEKP